MIVPTKRLIVLTAVVLTAVSLQAMRPVVWLPYVILGLGVFVSVAVADLFWGKALLRRMNVSSVPVIRMISERWSDLFLFFEMPEYRKQAYHVIPMVPAALQLKQKVFPVALNPGQNHAALNLECYAAKRGRYHLKACYVGQVTKLGLWIVRRKYPLQSEVRVYPNLLSGQKQVLGLFHRREWGWRNLRKVGKGREFEQLREYMPGDSYEDMDWKATARRRIPISRDYEVEQSQEIYIILDASRLSTRPVYANSHSAARGADTPEIPNTAVPTIFEKYIIGALTMAMAADRAADRYGLMIFGSKAEVFLKAGRGKSHYNACLEALYNHMPQTVSPDFEDVFAYIGSTIRKRALLVFLTSLDDPLISESFINTVGAVSNRHVIMVNMIRPRGAHPFFSTPLDGEGSTDTDPQLYGKLLGHMIWSSLSATRRKLVQLGAGFKLLNDAELSGQLIDQYREIKQRQIL